MGAMKEHETLKLAAEAARRSLAVLTKERVEAVANLATIDSSISMLQNVIATWEQIDPQATAQQQLLVEPPPIVEKATRGAITEKVDEIMSDRRPRSAGALQSEIKRRYNLDPTINAVSVALRRGVAKKKYEKTGRGEYVSL